MIRSPYDRYFERQGHINRTSYKLDDLEYLIFDDNGYIVKKGWRLNVKRNFLQPESTAEFEKDK